MIRLRSSILAHLLSSPASSVQRLLSAAARGIPPNPSFAVEEYLVDSCGLTRAQALKASTKLSHLKSPSNPDAVLAFLAGLGLSAADMAALVAKDPKFLCSGVGRTLEPIRDQLADLGLSHAEITRFVSLAPFSFRRRSVVSNLDYHLSLFGSYDKVLRAVKRGPYIILANLDKVIKPNVAFLHECGIDAIGIASLCLSEPRILGTKPEQLRAMVARTEAVGVPRRSGMFRLALQTVAFRSEETIAAKVDFLNKTFGWSDAEVGTAICKFPMLLAMSNDTMRSKYDFLISEVGLEPSYVAHQPSMLGLRLDGRLRSRYYVVKFLKENGLLDRGRSYYNSLVPAEKVFLEKYIHPYKESAPHLAQDYAAACRGEVPTNFRFT